MAEPLRCYRHPDRETYVSCSDCGRGICPDCMTYGPVGIRCPDHATTGAKAPAPQRVARRATRKFSVSGPIVTQVLIAINVAVFVLQLFGGADLMDTSSGWIYENGVLINQAVNSSGQLVGVAEGEWWRLTTATFLHGSIIHLGLNMLVLWFIGPALEDFFGRWRYLLLYIVSGLAGSAGALLLNPNTPTVGASGAIWGLMAAAVVLEARRIYVFGGQAMGLLVLNVLFTLSSGFVGGNVSVGGHIAGGIGGAIATFAFLGLRRNPALATLTVAAIGALSVAIAVFAV